MPTPYTMPPIPNRYPLDKNDKLGLLIGTLLSSGLAAAGSNNTGESPWLRGVAGATAGFGAGGKAINDSYSTMLDDYLKNEDMDFRNRQFDQQIREYEETDKPYKESQTRWNDALARGYGQKQEKTPEWLQKIMFREGSPENAEAFDRTFPKKSNIKEPDYLSKMERIDAKIANLESKDPSQLNPRIQALINSLRNIKGQYHNKLYGSGTSVKDLGFDFNTPKPLPASKPLDENTAMGFLNQANGDRNKARELARQAGYEF